ncbi:chaperonin 10-like protein [Tribonema minus]|uniref:Chaperonin 10-like protein n=1 Tax=Tribonema minus TaxID=303371 RepID=A0A836CLR8_9STRA|nr:chaperonin 10-like protein [Tribonema minus]
MQAAKYNWGVPTVVTLPKPSLVPGSVLVKVVCAGVNPVDAKNVIGDKLPAWEPCKRLTEWFVRDCTPGFDFAGTVVQAGDSQCNAGDHVFGTVPPFKGSFAEYVVAPVSQIALKPKALTFTEAAVLPLSGLTSIQSLSGRVKPGSNVLIIGASGGTGHVAVQVAAALGGRVTAVCSARNAGFVHALGAADAVAYHNDLIGAVYHPRSAQHGAFDVALDCVSSGDARDAAFGYEARIRGEPELLRGDFLRLGGGVVDWATAGCKRALGVNLFREGRELFWVRFPDSAQELRQLAEWADAGRLKPAVASVHPLSADGVAQAFADLRGRRVRGKVAIAVAPED